MTRRCISFVCITLAVAACQTRAPSSVPVQQTSARAVSWTSDFPFEEVAEQVLRDGQCGLALWTRAPESKRIFFGFSQPAFARLQLDGEMVEVRRSTVARETVLGHAGRQTYVSSRIKVDLDLQIVRRKGLQGSAVVEDGTLTLSDLNDARSIIVPVVGLIGCV